MDKQFESENLYDYSDVYCDTIVNSTSPIQHTSGIIFDNHINIFINKMIDGERTIIRKEFSQYNKNNSFTEPTYFHLLILTNYGRLFTITYETENKRFGIPKLHELNFWIPKDHIYIIQSMSPTSVNDLLIEIHNQNKILKVLKYLKKNLSNGKYSKKSLRDKC